MATSSAMAESEETGSCPVCLESYREREPKMLGCGHSMCKVCSDKLMGDKRRNHLTRTGPIDLQCPICREVTRVPAGGLPTNYSLQEVLHKFSSLNTKPPTPKEWRLCTACQQINPPDNFWYCEECAEKTPSSSSAEPVAPSLLCSRCCLRYHNGHRLLGLAELSQRRDVVKQRVQDLVKHFTDQLVVAGAAGLALGRQSESIAETLRASLTKEETELNAALQHHSFGLPDIARHNAKVDELRRKIDAAYAVLADANSTAEKTLQAAYHHILQMLAAGEMESVSSEGSTAQLSEGGGAAKRSHSESAGPVYTFGSAPAPPTSPNHFHLRRHIAKKAAGHKK